MLRMLRRKSTRFEYRHSYWAWLGWAWMRYKSAVRRVGSLDGRWPFLRARSTQSSSIEPRSTRTLLLELHAALLEDFDHRVGVLSRIQFQLYPTVLFWSQLEVDEFRRCGTGPGCQNDDSETLDICPCGCRRWVAARLAVRSPLAGNDSAHPSTCR
jgi:hypothetical protein